MVRLTSFLCLVLASVASASPVLQKRAGDVIPGQYIITFKESNNFAPRNVDALINDILGSVKTDLRRAESAELLHKYDFGSGQLQGFAAKLEADALTKVQAHPEVQAIEPDTVVTLEATQSGLDRGLWGIDSLDGRVDGSYTYPDSAGAGVDAYVIDTGVTVNHPDLRGRATWGASFTGESGQTDGNGHGTHVAGTIGGSTYGVAKKVNIIGVRVLGADGSGSNSGVVAGMNWVADRARSTGRKSVANMSLGGSKSSATDNAARALINANVALAVAAGNSAKDSCTGSPSNVKEAFTVAASDVNNRFASFSEFGPCVDIIAPGVQIKSAWNNGGTNTISGTSMATPHVTGALAVAYSQRSFSSPAEAFQFILSKAKTNAISGVPSGTPNKFLQI
ncbi:uncharacterized protein SPPG_03762 [Spizellomyces punctatus DAOM BR117]|uniref:Peptidase S8/S53 domain-containing protein n=1 Tax=Spizellomyces punctatus (strain DAOM BR117) TaxID=645134 RepID=A0A0L0HIE0_SPIPD|nr:uncharacterized protein SPPG_03762 [Spizellomyces punctatus DAOM BR117]KND00635.1 hypothetical protein SPPG_03762 [Spizellomyces punctatus DAOM BR117]|eukprot:XP_016608674.1 hypothetical protein SPPG_03762 [Spizellomyces punctatus DAOM BR117]